MNEVAQTALAAPAHDMSLLGLFWQAGFIVKFVMIGLLAASVWTWAIIFDKWTRYASFRRQLNQFENNFWSGQSLEELYHTLSDARPAAWARCSWPPCASGRRASRRAPARRSASRPASRRPWT